MKKVSIIVPVYNVECYLLDCLKSIQNQTYKNFEVICIDDGSSDKSGKILDAFSRADSRFICYHQENCGVSITRNRALSWISGDYITFVDSDDTLASEYLEELVKGIEAYDCEISVCGHDVIYPRLTFPISKRKSVVLSQKQALKEILSDQTIKNYAWGKCFKKECWENITFPEHEIYEDTSTIYQTFFKANKIFVSHKRLYHYYIRKGSLTQNHDPIVRKELKKAYQKQANDICQHYPEFKIFGFKNQIIADGLFLWDSIRKKLAN